jgi:hypothetical protein
MSVIFVFLKVTCAGFLVFFDTVRDFPKFFPILFWQYLHEMNNCRNKKNFFLNFQMQVHQLAS